MIITPISNGFVKFNRELLKQLPAHDLRLYGLLMFLALETSFTETMVYTKSGARVDLKPGQLYISQQRIAKALGMHRDTLRDYIKQLETLGLIYREKFEDIYVITIKFVYDGGVKTNEERTGHWCLDDSRENVQTAPSLHDALVEGVPTHDAGVCLKNQRMYAENGGICTPNLKGTNIRKNKNNNIITTPTDQEHKTNITKKQDDSLHEVAIKASRKPKVKLSSEDLGDEPESEESELPEALQEVFISEGKEEVHLNVWMTPQQQKNLERKFSSQKLRFALLDRLASWSTDLNINPKTNKPRWLEYRANYKDHYRLLLNQYELLTNSWGMEWREDGPNGAAFYKRGSI